MTPAPVCVCVFAKAPRPGEAKTRLAEAVGPEGAAALARAFLQDTWSLICGLPWARPVLAASETPAVAWAPHPARETWLQSGEDPGTRLEGVLRRAVAEAGAGIVLAADVPGLPAALVEEAVEALRARELVLGPSGDGGFYLVGARRVPAGLMAGLPWSTPGTLASLCERLRGHGVDHALVSGWDDVDGPEDLSRLARAVAAGSVVAPETERTLRGLGLLIGEQARR